MKFRVPQIELTELLCLIIHVSMNFFQSIQKITHYFLPFNYFSLIQSPEFSFILLSTLHYICSFKFSPQKIFFQLQFFNLTKSLSNIEYKQNFYILMQTEESHLDKEIFNYSKYSSPSYNLNSPQSHQDMNLLKSQSRTKRMQSLHSLRKINTGKEVVEMRFLRNLIKKLRIQRLISNFCSKIKRNITHSKPVEISLNQNSENQSQFVKWISTTQGLTISNNFSFAFLIFSTTMALLLSVFYSLELVFPEMQQYHERKVLQIVGLAVFLCQIFLGLITKHYKKGKFLLKIKQIAQNYLSQKFYLDLIVVVNIILYLSEFSNSLEFRLIRLTILIKLWKNIQKNDLIQTALITTFYREQYFGLVSVIFTNICFAHIMSLCLNGMALINPSENWLVNHQLAAAPWHVRYIWGVYWGTTIMFTVGFGDFAATNHMEALCLTFIEMVSCISLSYNINCVGNIITNIKSEKLQKKKNLRILSKMVKENRIEEELENRLNNYIEQAVELRREFNIEQEQKLLDYIPKTMKQDYLRTMSNRVFLEIPFLAGLTLKGRECLAEGVSRYITHPEEILLKKSAQAELLILNKGQLGFCIKNSQNCKGIVIQKLTVGQGQKSKLTSLDFIKSKRLNYFIKSISYSILYSIDKQNLVKCLKHTNIDYQMYCALRDKSVAFLRQYELYKCSYCINEYHSKFDCPKLHFIPFHQHVINKYIHGLKQGKQQQRIPINRKRSRFLHILVIYETELRDLSEFIEGESRKISSQRRIFDKEIVNRVESLLQDISTDPVAAKSEVQISTVEKISLRQQTKKYFEQMVMNHLHYSQNMEDSCDAMCNWNYYFPQFNPNRLKDIKF